MSVVRACINCAPDFVFDAGCSGLPYFPCWHFYDIYIAGRIFEKAPKGSQLSCSFEELTPRQNEAVSSRLARRRHRRKPGNYCGVPASPLFLLSRMWVIFHTSIWRVFFRTFYFVYKYYLRVRCFKIYAIFREIENVSLLRTYLLTYFNLTRKLSGDILAKSFPHRKRKCVY